MVDAAPKGMALRERRTPVACAGHHLGKSRSYFDIMVNVEYVNVPEKITEM